MKYTPKKIKTNVNISQTSSLRELFLLLSGALVVLIVIYVGLGFCVDIIAPRIPYEVEQGLGKLFNKFYEKEQQTDEADRLRHLLAELEKGLAEKKREYTIHLVKNPQVNAMALPGGHIVVFTGLLNRIDTDHELAFVLAHELGHFINRDHLRGLGRGLLIWAFFATILGQDNSATNFLGNSLMGIQMKFSRHQETMADMFALELISRCYGHVSGAKEFMKKIASDEKKGRMAYYFATHPFPAHRIANINNEIKEKGYSLKYGLLPGKSFGQQPE